MFEVPYAVKPPKPQALIFMPPTRPRSDGQSDFVYLSTVSEKDKCWDKHRSAATKIAVLYRRSGDERYAQRIDNCSRWLDFHLISNQTGEVQFKLQETRFCRVRHCPVCQWRRSMMWRARFFQIIPKVMEAHPKARFIFLTLTVKNCALNELRSTTTLMSKAWQRLIQKKVFPAIGYVRSLEVTRSEDGSAHPHFHCILLVPGSYFGGKEYISQAKWTQMWKGALRCDYTPVVNVKAVKQVDGIEKAILETLKYSVKEDDLLSDPQWLAELTSQMHKVRAISVGGVLKQFINEEEPEDLIHSEDAENFEQTNEATKIWFSWRERLSKYATRSKAESEDSD